MAIIRSALIDLFNDPQKYFLINLVSKKIERKQQVDYR